MPFRNRRQFCKSFQLPVAIGGSAFLGEDLVASSSLVMRASKLLILRSVSASSPVAVCASTATGVTEACCGLVWGRDLDLAAMLCSARALPPAAPNVRATIDTKSITKQNPAMAAMVLKIDFILLSGLVARDDSESLQQLRVCCSGAQPARSGCDGEPIDIHQCRPRRRFKKARSDAGFSFAAHPITIPIQMRAVARIAPADRRGARRACFAAIGKGRAGGRLRCSHELPRCPRR
jgi:hypothetical protein